MAKKIKRYSTIVRPITIGMGLVIIIAGIKSAAPLLNLFLSGFFLAILLKPIYEWLQRRGLPTWLIIVVMIAGIIGFGVILFAFVWVSLSQLSIKIPTYQANLTAQVEAIDAQLTTWGVDTANVELPDWLNLGTFFRVSASILTGVGNVLFGFFVVVVIVIFMLIEASGYSDRLRQELGSDSTLLVQYTQFTQALFTYLIVRIQVNFATALPATLLLLVIGVDFATLWGVLTFFLTFIPYIGFILAYVPPTLLALIEFGPVEAGIVIVGYVIINIIAENILAPRLMGRGLKLSAAVVIISLFFWSWALGALGALLAMPLTILVKMIFENYDDTRWLAVLMSSNDPQKPAVPAAPQNQQASDQSVQA